MRTIFSMIATWLMCSCKSNNQDDYNSAALDALWPRLEIMNETAQYISNYSQADIDKNRAEIATIRAWAAKQKPQVRSGYEYWLDWYANGCDEAERELKHGKRRSEMEKFDRNIEEQLQRSKALNIPTP